MVLKKHSFFASSYPFLTGVGSGSNLNKSVNVADQVLIILIASGKRLFIITAFLIFSANLAFSHTPTIINLQIDGSLSVPEKEFDKINSAVVEFIRAVNTRSLVYPNVLCDWLSIGYFGGDDEYDEAIFVDSADTQRMLALMTLISRQAHPEYGGSAIFSAIGRSAHEIRQHEKILRTNGVEEDRYIRNIIVITDGRDSSENRIKGLIKRTFPNDYTNLILIGVGPEANLNQFERVSDITVIIDDMEKLLTALIYILQYI